MSDSVLLERRDSVAIVTMNVPQKRNALGRELVEPLAKLLHDLQDDNSVRALVLHGGKHFCAGGDLGSLGWPALEMRQYMQVAHRIVRTLIGGRLPVVAAVEGNAFGAGFSVALACDFVVADSSTAFCAAFGRIGLVPDLGLLWSLPQRVGIGKTREIMMFCEPINGANAQALGLVDKLVDAGAVLNTAISMAERLAAAPPGTISTTKAALARLPMNLDAMLAWEADTQAMLVQSEDVREGISAFREKRVPQFKGR
jgi:2-(1,2-epoxy-1,2-dihydrophenyl)acetyl-CoA isomerase